MALTDSQSGPLERGGIWQRIAANLILLIMVFGIKPVFAAEKAIEEIEVIGQRPLLNLRMEARQAEIKAFDLFNELNDQSLFDVICADVQVTGSRIRERECVPSYIYRARMLNARDFMFNGTVQKTEQEIWSDNSDRTRRFNEKMRELATEHPELADALAEVSQTREALTAAEESR